LERPERVTRVLDGYTFKTASRKNPVRLASEESSKNGRPGAINAARILRDLIEGKAVEIEPVGEDDYGRTVARVYLAQNSTNHRKSKNKKKRAKS
jgi:endonuclease YncB( thermonuclease family)